MYILCCHFIAAKSAKVMHIVSGRRVGAHCQNREHNMSGLCQSLCVPVHKFVRGCVNKGYHTNANEGWRVKDHNANRGCEESSESVCVCVCVLHFPKMPCT